MDNISYGLIGVSRLLLDEDDDNEFQGFSEKEYKSLSEESQEGAESRLSDAILHNIHLVQKIIVKCGEIGIRHYRIPNSFLCVNFLDKKLQEFNNSDEIIKGIRNIGALSRSRSVTVSIHADPLNSLVGSDNVVESSIKELEFYGEVFKIMGLSKNIANPIVLTLPPPTDFEETTEFIDEFYSSFKRLDKNTESRIVISNCNKGFWNCINLFKFAHVYMWERYNKLIPLTFNLKNDILNPSEINDGQIETEVNVGAFHATWNGVVPVFTWTELNEDLKPKDTLYKSIPDFGNFIKWECDVKDKDIAIFELLHPDEERKITDDDLNQAVTSAYSSAKQNYSEYSKFNMLYNR